MSRPNGPRTYTAYEIHTAFTTTADMPLSYVPFVDYEKEVNRLNRELNIVIAAKDNAIDQANAYKAAGEELAKEVARLSKALEAADDRYSELVNKSMLIELRARDAEERLAEAEKALEFYRVDESFGWPAIEYFKKYGDDK